MPSEAGLGVCVYISMFRLTKTDVSRSNRQTATECNNVWRSSWTGTSAPGERDTSESPVHHTFTFVQRIGEPMINELRLVGLGILDSTLTTWMERVCGLRAVDGAGTQLSLERTNANITSN